VLVLDHMPIMVPKTRKLCIWNLSKRLHMSLLTIVFEFIKQSYNVTTSILIIRINTDHINFQPTPKIFELE
jgi:hypothetical protein